MGGQSLFYFPFIMSLWPKLAQVTFGSAMSPRRAADRFTRAENGFFGVLGNRINHFSAAVQWRRQMAVIRAPPLHRHRLLLDCLEDLRYSEIDSAEPRQGKFLFIPLPACAHLAFSPCAFLQGQVLLSDSGSKTKNQKPKPETGSFFTQKKQEQVFFGFQFYSPF